MTFSAAAQGLETSGEVTLSGRYPFRAHAALALEDATRLLEGGAPAGLRIRAVGELDADGELRGLARGPRRGAALAAPGSYADLRIEATVGRPGSPPPAAAGSWRRSGSRGPTPRWW